MTPGVDFFRVDRSRATYRILTVAVLLIMIGVTTIGSHLVSRLSAETSHLVTLGGGISTLAGLVLGFGSMAMMLLENVYLAIKPEGLIVHDNGKETVVSWDALVTAKADERDGFVVFERTAGEPIRFHAGGGAPNVARRVEEAARKAAHGLLK